MSAGQFPQQTSPTTNGSAQYRDKNQTPRRVPVPEFVAQKATGMGMGMNMGTNTGGGMRARGLPTPSPEITTSAWQTQDFDRVLSAPVLQSPDGQMMTNDALPYRSPRGQQNEQLGQPSVSPSRSPNMHLRTPSQVDTLLRHNAQLRHELDELRAERDQTQAACDSMLTELMTTQETLQEREAQLQSLREHQSSNQQHSPIPGGGGLSRNDEKELRDLRLRCHRLQGECTRKDQQIREAESRAMMHQNMYGGSGGNKFISPTPAQHNRELSDAQQRFMDAESRANYNAQLHQAALTQADTYAKQLNEWSDAYESLKQNFNNLQHSHTQLSQTAAMEMTRSREEQQQHDGETAKAASEALNDLKRMRDFFQQNCEKVAKKNIEITDQMRMVQDALHDKTRAFDQQRAMLESLQGQVQ